MKSDGNPLTLIGAFAVLALLTSAPPPTFGQSTQQGVTQTATVRSITHVTGDLFRVRSDEHYTVFLRTSQGIILADPINRETATWLKREFESRFHQSVRYVLHSHHHHDHAAGASVFADTAEIIGHENFAAGLKQSRTTLDPYYRPADRNFDNRLSRDELTGRFAWLSRLNLDQNGDGMISPAEMYADVMPPRTTIKQPRTITLGGKHVEMIPLAPCHSDDMVVLVFHEERAAFVVDLVPISRLPLNVDGAPLQSWILAAKQIEALDFDTLIPGHHEELGTKADAVAYRQMLEKLMSGVSQGLRRGQTLEQLQSSDLLTEYEHWANYDSNRTDLIASAFANLHAGSAK
jgi:glyoxylase-like metal-dependent hydrolase (beta-lactamase superfamily II)